MRIAALSDFHIGSLDRNDGFHHDESAFLEYLDRLEETHDRIVVLGDVFQAEHGWVVGHRVAAAELERARRRVPRLWDRLCTERYVYVHGNHDAAARERLSARHSLRVEADGYAAYFIHGHQFDPLLNGIYPLARTGTWLMGRARWLGLRPVAEWFEHKDIALKHERFKGPDGPYVTAGRRLLAEQRVDVVVMGHTHMPDRVEVDGGIVANTGSCSMGMRMHVSLDTQARTVKVVHE